MTTRRVLMVARPLASCGGAPHLRALTQGLQARGWEVGLASASAVGTAPAPGPRWLDHSGVRTFAVPLLGARLQAGSLLGSVRAFGQLAAIARAFRPDLLHVHSGATSPHAQYVRATQGVPFVSTLHPQPLPPRAVHRACTFWGTRTIAVTSETQDFLLEVLHLDPARVRVVHDGADDAHFRPPTPQERAGARAGLGLVPEERAVALVGRLEPVKGHAVLLEAVARVRRAGGARVVALLAGIGSAEADLRTQAERLGVVGHVRFLGYADTRQVLWASDVAVLPSLREGFGLVVVEAMLCRVVPVRTPSGGARDQIDEGVSGFIVPFGDAAALAARLQALFDDEALRERVAQAALVKARARFTLARMVEGTEGVYAEALQQETHAWTPDSPREQRA